MFSKIRRLIKSYTAPITLSTMLLMSMAVMLAQGPAAPTSVHVEAGLTAAFTCDQTFSSATGLQNAIATAANNTTICLNNGSYGTMNLWDMNRTGYVTVRSTTGVGASFRPMPGNSKFMKFQSLTLLGSGTDNCSKHIQYLDNVITGNQLVMGTTPCTDASDFLVDGNTFNAYDSSGGIEGRLSITSGANGVTITDNIFQNGGCSDGIQVVDSTNITIQRNQLLNLIQGSCGTHVDSLQIVPSVSNITITQNYFKNNSVNLGLYDGVTNMTISYNVFDGLGNSDTGTRDMQMGNAHTANINHNTWRECNIEWSSDPGDANTGIIFQNNILDDSSVEDTQGNFCGADCIIRYNLLSRGSTFQSPPSCTNCVTGTATYTGGGATPPTTWAGWQLQVGSPGINVANDGTNMGTTYYGP